MVQRGRKCFRNGSGSKIDVISSCRSSRVVGMVSDRCKHEIKEDTFYYHNREIQTLYNKPQQCIQHHSTIPLCPAINNNNNNNDEEGWIQRSQGYRCKGVFFFFAITKKIYINHYNHSSSPHNTCNMPPHEIVKIITYITVLFCLWLCLFSPFLAVATAEQCISCQCCEAHADVEEPRPARLLPRQVPQ